MVYLKNLYVDTLSNTAESEKTNKLTDGSLGNAINKPRLWSSDKVRVNGRPIL